MSGSGPEEGGPEGGAGAGSRSKLSRKEKKRRKRRRERGDPGQVELLGDDEQAAAPESGAAAPTEPADPPVPRPFGNQLARARDLVESGRIQEAIAVYQDVLASSPANLKAHNNLGVLLDELGKHRLAVEHFEAALEADGDNVEVLTNYGSALTELARFDEADAVLEKAQRLAPAEPTIRLAVGVLAFRRGLYEKAATELRSVCDRDADNGLAHFYRGEALNRTGAFDEAIEVMARAAELLPRDPRPAYTLGHLYDRKGRRLEASEMYRRARDLQSGAESRPISPDDSV